MDGATSDSDASSSALRKGKCRAPPEDLPSERTPLLGPSGQHSSSAVAGGFDVPTLDAESHRRRRRHRLLARLLSVFLGTLGICIIAALVLVALAHSYEERVETALKSGALDRSLVWRGPDRIDILNATEGKVWLLVDVRAGVDAGYAVDTVIGYDEGWSSWIRLPSLQRALGRWAVRQVGEMTVTVDGITMLAGERFLADVTLPTITLPLTAEAPDDPSWLTHLSLPLQIRITQNVSDLADFARESWANGYVSGYVAVDRVSVYGGEEDENSWRRKLQTIQHDVRIPARIKSKYYISYRKSSMKLNFCSSRSARPPKPRQKLAFP